MLKIQSVLAVFERKLKILVNVLFVAISRLIVHLRRSIAVDTLHGSITINACCCISTEIQRILLGLPFR